MLFALSSNSHVVGAKCIKMKNERAKRSFRRCRHGYLFSILLLCEVVLSLTCSCCPSKNMRTYTSPWAGDVKISDDSVNSAKFAILKVHN